MRTDITKEEVIALHEDFKQYAETAEQHELPIIAILHEHLQYSINTFDTMNCIEKNAMFRTVYRFVGKDYTDFLPE